MPLNSVRLRRNSPRVPAGASVALGGGNPLAIASIKPGETELDWGTGAGFFLAVRKLAGSGR